MLHGFTVKDSSADYTAVSEHYTDSYNYDDILNTLLDKAIVREFHDGGEDYIESVLCRDTRLEACRGGILFILCGDSAVSGIKEKREMEQYEELIMETIEFDTQDVITTSNNETGKASFDDLYIE